VWRADTGRTRYSVRLPVVSWVAWV
jgi:hypothetical protein